MSQTLGELLRATTRALVAADIDGAPREARLMVAHAAALPLSRLTLELQEPVADTVQPRVLRMVARRFSREPLSHILGRRAFYDHDFKVTAAVLDPRPETEALVIEALRHPFGRVLDLGTGSGAIAISLLAARPSAQGVATDLSQAALDVARENATSIGVANRLTLLQSNWYDALDGQFDLIVSNPPYIALDEMPSLAPELSFEPRMALTDEADGLSAYRTIIHGAPTYLAPNGRLMVEIGWQQGPDVAALFLAAGFHDIAVLPDLDGRDRVVLGQLA